MNASSESSEQDYPTLSLKRNDPNTYWTQLNYSVSTIVWNESVVFGPEIHYRLEAEGYPSADVDQTLRKQRSATSWKQQILSASLYIMGSPLRYYYKRGRFTWLRDAALSQKNKILDIDKRRKPDRKEKPLIDVVTKALQIVNIDYGRERFIAKQNRTNSMTIVTPPKTTRTVKLNGQVDIVVIDSDSKRTFSLECKNWANVVDLDAFESPKEDFRKNMSRRKLGLIPVFIVRKAYETVRKRIREGQGYIVETRKQYYLQEDYEQCGKDMKEKLDHYFIESITPDYMPDTDIVNQIRSILESGT